MTRSRNRTLNKSGRGRYPRTRSSMIRSTESFNKKSNVTNKTITGENLDKYCMDNVSENMNGISVDTDNPERSLHEQSLSNENSVNTSQNGEGVITVDSQSNLSETSSINNDIHSLYCYSSCVNGRRHGPEMIQCSLCMNLIHVKCSDAKNQSIQIWKCTKCRNLPDTVEELKQQLVEVHELLSDMIEKQSDFYKCMYDITTTNNKLKQEVKQLKKENYQLRLRKYKKLSNNSSDSSSDSSSGDESEMDTTVHQISPNKSQIYDTTKVSLPSEKVKRGTLGEANNKQTPKPKVTLLGGSMVRNTGPILAEGMKQEDSTVYSVSGLSIEKAAEMSQDIFTGHSAQDTVLLQVGTCDVINSSTDQLVSKYTELIQSVKLAAPESKLIITAVPHRVSVGSTSINQKTDALNLHLRSRCTTDKKMFFIDANPPVQGSNYKEDGYHFNYNGTKFFARYVSHYLCHSQNFITTLQAASP